MSSLAIADAPTAPRSRLAVYDVVGCLVGAVLPLVAALLYRTYAIDVSPNWLELTRQMGLPFVAGEVGVIMSARHRSYSPIAVLRALPKLAAAALLLFVATFWISSVLISRYPPFSSVLNMIWIVHLLFAGAVYHLASDAEHLDVDRFALWGGIGLLVLAIWTAIHFLTPPPGLIVPVGQRGWGGAVPGFISHRLFGSWTGAVAVLMLGLLWTRAKGGGWRYPAFMLASGLMMWTGTRAALLAAAAGIMAGILLAGRPASREVYWKVPAAFALAAIVAMMLVPYDDPSFMFYRPGSYGTADGISSGRMEFWLSSLRVAAARPLLGWGSASCWWLVPLYGANHVQPHNAIVQFLLSWGLIPSIPLLALIAWATWRAHRIARGVPGIVPLVMMLDGLLVMSMVDGMLYFARFVMLIVTLYALCFAAGRQSSS